LVTRRKWKRGLRHGRTLASESATPSSFERPCFAAPERN